MSICNIEHQCLAFADIVVVMAIIKKRVDNSHGEVRERS